MATPHTINHPYINNSGIMANTTTYRPGGTTRVVQLGKNNTTPRDKLYDGT